VVTARLAGLAKRAGQRPPGLGDLGPGRLTGRGWRRETATV